MKPLLESTINEISKHVVGLNVKLTHPDPNYRIGKQNPATDTKYECVGKIEGYSKDAGVMRVIWENGHSNTYKIGELTEVCKEEGNFIDIWEMK